MQHVKQPERTCKLDMYDYYLVKGNRGTVIKIVIPVESPTDIMIADIVTDINACRGNIFVEGHYCLFQSIDINLIDKEWTEMVIHVAEVITN